jgi:hypothetical protein
VLAKNTPLFRSLLTVLDISPEQIEDSTVGTFFAPSDEVGWLGAAVDKEKHAGLYVLIYACICVGMGLRSQLCMHMGGIQYLGTHRESPKLHSAAAKPLLHLLQELLQQLTAAWKSWLAACHMHACKGGCAVQAVKHALGPAVQQQHTQPTVQVQTLQTPLFPWVCATPVSQCMQAIGSFLQSMGMTAKQLTNRPELVDLIVSYHFAPGGGWGQL